MISVLPLLQNRRFELRHVMKQNVQVGGLQAIARPLSLSSNPGIGGKKKRQRIFNPSEERAKIKIIPPGIRDICADLKESYSCFPSVVGNTYRLISNDTKHNHNATQQLPKINVHATCPYKVLNIPVNSPYSTAKSTFLKAALVYHPDRVNTGNAAIFIRIRDALEEIFINTTNGSSHNETFRSDKKYDPTAPRQKGWSTPKRKDEFYQSLEDEISLLSEQLFGFHMDKTTHEEVVSLYKRSVQTSIQNGHNFNDKGGYWEMARILTEREALLSSRGNKPTVEGLLSSGIESINDASSTIRNRRKRK